MPPLLTTIPKSGKKGAARGGPERNSRAPAERHPHVPGRWERSGPTGAVRFVPAGQTPQTGSTLARHRNEAHLDRRQREYLDRRQYSTLRALYLFVVEDFLLPLLHPSYGGELPDRDASGDFEEPLRYGDGPLAPFETLAGSSVPFRRQAYRGSFDLSTATASFLLPSHVTIPLSPTLGPRRQDPLSPHYRAFRVDPINRGPPVAAPLLSVLRTQAWPYD